MAVVTEYDVRTYGAVGDGSTDDTTAINAAITAAATAMSGSIQVTRGAIIVFSPTNAGYATGTTQAFQLPPGVGLSGVARLPFGLSQDPSFAVDSPDGLVNSGLVLVPAWSASAGHGILSQRDGHVFDSGGRTLDNRSPITFVGNAVAVGDGEILHAIQIVNNAFFGIKQTWSDDQLATYMLSDWILSDESAAFTISSASGATITVSGASWTTNQWVGKYIKITSGPDAGDVQSVASNTSNTITISGTFTHEPTSGVFYIGSDLFDPELLMMPDGHTIMCGCHGSTNQLRFILSTDGGRTWTEKTPINASSGLAYTCVKMIRTKIAVAPVENRILLLFNSWSSSLGEGDYQIYKTDDLATSWQSVTTALTGGVIGGLKNQMNGIHGTLYITPQPPHVEVIIPFTNSGDTVPGRLYQIECDANGQSPGTPTLVTTTATAFGSFPHAIRLRTGEYGLYYGQTWFTTPPSGQGQVHFMTSPTGLSGTYVFDRTLWTVSGYPNGYGFIRPSRLTDARLVLLNAAVINSTTTRTLISNHYGA